MDVNTSLTGVILAGGKNRRMGGSDKALLTLGEKTILERQIEQINKLAIEIILVTNQPKRYHPFLTDNIQCTRDKIPGHGPISGIHAAMLKATGTSLWVVGCDMPFVSPYAAKEMLDVKESSNYDVVVPYINHHLHPLHGIYDKACLGNITNMIHQQQFKLRELFEYIGFYEANEAFFQSKKIPLQFVYNMNTPEDYEKAKKMGERYYD
ncbi:molybdenum cofactor guanylyltransferase [Salinibacillus xinjiangensis]|nr:molybdenum cofactor guanylyltransferase [Salinibacillus xinjiangensis]